MKGNQDTTISMPRTKSIATAVATATATATSTSKTDQARAAVGKYSDTNQSPVSRPAS